MKDEKQYEVIIVGGSYSGLAAAMALGRALRSVLIIDSGDPCNRQTPYSHNFLTNDGKPPAEIARLAKQEVQKYNTVNFLSELATKGEIRENEFAIQVQCGDTFVAKKLVFATGIKDLMPNIPGFQESWGISVLHCPYCHGYEVRHQKTGILANGDDGFELSSLIANWTGDLTLYTNGKSTLSADQANTIRKHHIAVEEAEVERLDQQNGHIQNIIFGNGKSAPVTALYARLPFVQHSTIPFSLGAALTSEGYLSIDAAQRTTIPGVYACGDNTTRMRTVANAVAMGTTTGFMVNRELIDENF